MGVTVQTELKGRPEHAKVTVPLSVLDGTTVTVANAVDPWAVPALSEVGALRLAAVAAPPLPELPFCPLPATTLTIPAELIRRCCCGRCRRRRCWSCYRPAML